MTSCCVCCPAEKLVQATSSVINKFSARRFRFKAQRQSFKLLIAQTSIVKEAG